MAASPLPTTSPQLLREHTRTVRERLRHGLGSLGPFRPLHRAGLGVVAFACAALLLAQLAPGILVPVATLGVFLGLLTFGARTLWALWPRTGRLAGVRRRFRWPVVLAVMLLGGWIPHLLAFVLAVALGVFTVESIDRLARHLGERAKPLMRRPLRFGWGFVATLIALSTLGGILYAGLARTGAPEGVVRAVGVGYLSTHGALTVVTIFSVVLVIAATLGLGRADMPRRIFYACAFFVPLAAYYGYLAGGLYEGAFPWWVVVLIGLVLLARTGAAIYRLGRRAALRFLPEGTAWDLLLTLAFSTLYVFAAGPYGDALLGMEALRATSVTGLLLGAVAFPWLPRLRRAYARWKGVRAAGPAP